MDERHEDGVDMVRALTRWQRLGLATLFVVGVFVVGAAVFVWTGYYNISAKSKHWDFVTAILETVRDQSIRTRASGIAVPDLDDPAMIALGREHFRGGCASCHGLPDQERNPVAIAMLPDPPDLLYAHGHYDARALFWLIDNGIKYTGMPAWPADDRQDEVWPMVAYLIDLYARRETPTPVPDSTPDGVAVDDFGFHTLPECSRCHGDADTPPISALVPELAGQPVEYLARALREYRAGTRPSGYMIPAAYSLTDAEISDLAAYYAQIVPRAAEIEGDAARIARGAEIALRGVPSQDVPACTGCHGNGNPQFPHLAGQSERYLFGQLDLWQRGGRDLTGHGEIMSVIAERLTPGQIRDVSAYFSSLPPPETGESRP